MVKSTPNTFLYLFFALFIGPFYLKCQINNSALETPIIPTEDTSNAKIKLKSNFLGYLKNNEYFNPLVDGYTLFGYWLNPKLNIKTHANVNLQIGAFVGKNFGDKGFDTITPTLSLLIKQKKWDFIFGNLQGAYMHKNIEPLYNFENGITQSQELGLQAIYRNKKTIFDAWLDWRQHTKPGKSSQEHISGNFNYHHNPFKISSTELSFPIQCMIYHRGGQNIPLKLPITTTFNTALGNIIRIKLDSTKTFSFENYIINALQDSLNGFGYMGNLSFNTSKFQFIATYWHGNDFFSPRGGFLYQSYASKLNSIYYEKKRDLLLFRIIYNTPIAKGLSFSLRVEPYWDLNSQIFEHCEGIYFTYNIPDIKIW